MNKVKRELQRKRIRRVCRLQGGYKTPAWNIRRLSIYRRVLGTEALQEKASVERKAAIEKELNR